MQKAIFHLPTMGYPAIQLTSNASGHTVEALGCFGDVQWSRFYTTIDSAMREVNAVLFQQTLLAPFIDKGLPS